MTILDQEVSPISFRELVTEIPSTTYATHSIHYYPASFIPQVVRYCLNKFTKPQDWILDPFAGSGAVGVECFITKRNAMLVDINPLTDWLVKAKLLLPQEDAIFEMRQLLLKSISYDGRPFVPKWANLGYWHPSIVAEFLTKFWGYFHYECTGYLKSLLAFALLDMTRLLSYTDDQVPKLFKSKRKTKKLNNLLMTDWKKTAIEQYKRTAEKYLNASFELKNYVKGEKPSIEVYSPKDIEIWTPPRSYKLMITSPPYLQAQEYIRSSKIDLYWLGYDDREVKRLSKLEIPYRFPKGKVHTPTLDAIRRKVIEMRRNDLLRLFDSYFYFVLTNFLKVSKSLQPEGRLCIFVGSATVAGIKVPLWKIIGEYFQDYGFAVENVLEDRIVARKLFGYRNNLNPNGIISEYLTILKHA
jgi:DNA modification methylase